MRDNRVWRMRDKGAAKVRAMCLAIGIKLEGMKEVLVSDDHEIEEP